MFNYVVLKISIVKQERAQSRLESEKQDAAEREDKRQMDQLVQKQRAVISATTVEPKVIYIRINFLVYFKFIYLVSWSSSC
jgi:hypothetical protein